MYASLKRSHSDLSQLAEVAWFANELGGNLKRGRVEAPGPLENLLLHSTNGDDSSLVDFTKINPCCNNSNENVGAKVLKQEPLLDLAEIQNSFANTQMALARLLAVSPFGKTIHDSAVVKQQFWLANSIMKPLSSIEPRGVTKKLSQVKKELKQSTYDQQENIMNNANRSSSPAAVDEVPTSSSFKMDDGLMDSFSSRRVRHHRLKTKGKSTSTSFSDSENSNSGGDNNQSKSKYRGVCWNKCNKSWKASIKVKGRNHHIGYFDKVEEAALAYDLKALEVRGSRAVLNFPDPFAELKQKQQQQPQQ